MVQVPFGYGPGHIDGCIPNSKREFSVRQLCHVHFGLVLDRGRLSTHSGASALYRPESKLAQCGDHGLLLAARMAVEQNLSDVVCDRQRRNPVSMSRAARGAAGTVPLAAQSANDLLRRCVPGRLGRRAGIAVNCKLLSEVGHGLTGPGFVEAAGQLPRLTRPDGM